MESIWKETVKPKKRKLFNGTRQEKVVVIGAGMAGILTAYLLQEAGVSVTVLEAETVGSGQTMGTTAKITSQHGMIYDYLREGLDAERAIQYARANEAAISEYERIVAEQKISCGFRRCPAYLYALDGVGADERIRRLKKEAKAASACGIKAELVVPGELPFAVAGAELFPDQACFSPLQFLYAIADRLTVYEHSKVIKAEENCVYTSEGMIEAESIVFAVHYPWMVVPGFYFLRMHQERSCVLALKVDGQQAVAEGSRTADGQQVTTRSRHTADGLHGMYRDMEKAGCSLRSYNGYVLLGGSEYRTGKNKNGGKYDALRKMAGEWYPNAVEAAHWSAQDCVTLDRVPYIGHLSASIPNWYVATGFGKWGMTSSMVSAMILKEMIMGRAHADEAVFSPQRMNWKVSVPQLSGNMGAAVVNLTRRLWPIGEYKACRHMGCRLNYNPEEETWDCPCHGSRYDKAGNLLDGPAQKPLTTAKKVL